MLIQPDTYIKLIKNCPLDDTYDHTIYFNNESEQVNYFKNTLDGITFAKQSYQRYDSGVLHIQEKAERLYSCNYLMFQNTAFGNKWFYAFVNKVEYVNNVSSKVYYTIDVMQTWFFEYTLQKSLVEREHPLTDAVGENLVPENLETGEYVFNKAQYSNQSAEVTPFKRFSICIMATFDDKFSPAQGGYYGRSYSGLRLNVFDSANAANTFIAEATKENLADGIVAVFMIPTAFIPGDPKDNYPTTYSGYKEEIRIKDRIGNYIPKNNKLLTHPYNFIMVTNNQGESNEFRYEYFYKPDSVTEVSSGFVGFHVNASRCNTYEYSISPFYYKGLEENPMERVVISNTPQCAYNVDTFKAWLAQNKHSLYTEFSNNSEIGSITTALAFATGNPVGAVGAGLSQLAKTHSLLAKVEDHSSLPPTAKGHTGAGTLNINTGIFGFTIYYASITEEFARIIDDFFTVYGYATNKVKVPNTHSRPHWNYVKTANCVATGGVPADDMKKICSIYNNGITFWKNGNEIGNYSLDNRP